LNLIVFVCLSVTAAHGAMVGLASAQPIQETKQASTRDRTSTEDRAPIESDTADLQAKRTAAANELHTIDSPSTLRKGAPPGVPESDLMERRSLLQQLVQIYERHLDGLGKLALTNRRLEEIDRQNKEWNGFSDPPPYSVLMADDLRDAVRSSTLTAQGIQNRLTMTEGLVESGAQALSRLQEQARQAAEQVEGVRDSVRLEQLTWNRQLAQLRERVAAARLSMLDTAKKSTQDELAEEKQRSALLERQHRAAEENVRFTQEDFEKITGRLDADQQALASEIERASRAQSEQRHAVAAAEQALADARKSSSSTKKGSSASQQRRVAQLTETLDLQRLKYDNVNLKIDLLRQLVDGVRQERHIWERRFASAQGTISLGEDRDAIAKLASIRKSVQSWREYAFQQLTMVSKQVSELTERLEQTPAPQNADHLRSLVAAWHHRETLYRPVLQRTDALLSLIDHRQADFERRQGTLPLSDRAREWEASVSAALRNLWNFELFAAEDTIEVEGKTVTGRRSITVGKVLKALAILVGGYWLSILLARFVERKAISRFHIDPNVANIIRQWALAVLFSILVVITLMSVKIPLTAFAFLGGALAIGVGFGTQNLLKNVISGILLLMERPLRVGDVIEVDGIRGMVTTIGLRSSTIRDATGVETLIPNSTLLERNLTNWTYSSYQKRYALSITVSAGPSTRGVKDLLINLALQHGQVLKTPEPHVLLEAFKEGALVLSLQYWVEIGPAIDPAMIASDLRFMIEDKLAEAGIVRK
jgi:small-conductance mechanosensitive channel